MSGFRHCLSSVMDPCAAWDGVQCGPRKGPACSDYVSDFDAAGHPFERGEPELRAIHIDSMPQRRRSVGPSARDGAAGAASPRVEVRALSIDDAVRRRAHSEPPADLKPRATRADLKLAMQAFGVIPDIDAAVHHRRRCGSPDMFTTTPAQAGKMAASFGDIQGLLKRRHFHGSPRPGNLLSPRLAARALEMVDIDAHARPSLAKNKTASTGVLPASSPCYDLAACSSPRFPGSPRGRTSTEFFQKTLEAKEYAKLLGRADVRCNHKSLAHFSANDLERELKNLQKKDSLRGKMLDEKGSPQRELSKVLMALESPAESYRSLRSASKESISTTTSTEAALQSIQISDSAKFALAKQVCKFMSAHAEEGKDSEHSSHEPESEGQPDQKVPIKLRRVLSAIDTNNFNLPEAMDSIRSSLLPIFQQDKPSKSKVSDLQEKMKPPCEQQKAYCGRGQRYSLRSNALQEKP